jgi:hypothetical protein
VDDVRPSCSERHCDLIHPGEVVRQYLLDAAFLFRLLLQGIQVLQEEIAHGVRELELEWQQSFSGVDSEHDLHLTLKALGSLSGASPSQRRIACMAVVCYSPSTSTR